MKPLKKAYYVSVGHRVIREAPHHHSAEFKVFLDDEDLVKLRDKLTELSREDDFTFQRAPIPYKSADHDEATEHFNKRLIELYTLLYQFGDDQTRQTIISLGVLGKLQNPDYHHPGYDGAAPFNS
ncbi:hypothetical protein [Paenibacillus fonticola]|uniref:hypothetical protein n=1 Tax=Paenibacillus fonticola TaxID=379896 RepID=UPI0003678D23|nr:hypothetical protein [Paenibacillus fonticola]